MGDVKPDKAAADTDVEKISSNTTALVGKPFILAKAVVTT